MWTGEGAVFNSLRAQRPGLKVKNGKNQLEKLIKNSAENCDFCNPEKSTPEDSFGRVKGKFCITAANLAKYDAWSSLLIFKKHNPLEFTQRNYLIISKPLLTGFIRFTRRIRGTGSPLWCGTVYIRPVLPRYMAMPRY